VEALFYIRLIALTAGTLVYLFLIALILGHRRPRTLERLLFFLVLSIFLIYAGGLLQINAQIQYGGVPPSTSLFYLALQALGLVALPGLLLHTFLQFRSTILQKTTTRLEIACVALLYALPFVDAWRRGALSRPMTWPNFLLVLTILGVGATDVLAFAAGGSAWIAARIWAYARDRVTRRFFQSLASTAALMSILLVLHLTLHSTDFVRSTVFEDLMFVLGVAPGALLIYFALKHNFLEYGAQRNLVYALSATFLALLYLALVHRVSGWLEPVLPREATASILLFVLIFLFEPLEWAIGPRLHRAMSERMARVQRLAVEIQQQARQGDVAEMQEFIERRVREEFGLAAVRLSVPVNQQLKALEAPGGLGHVVRIALRKDGKEIGALEAASTGTYLTGETTAALEFLGEQLPGMIDLCRLIEEKLQLERALAERERLALLGQMAASVSHNLRNPLSSMKTILQVQLENPDLPLDVRHDCALVVGEVDRMGEKLKQLLNFAKPSVNGQRVAAVALVRQTASLFGRDAERRNLRLEFDGPAREIEVLASEEALNEVLSNLIVNAIEAQPNGGRVRVGVSSGEVRLEIRVEDDGPGITAELRKRIFEPYFTTKASGTGLGLAIVVRRVEELGGTIACESPIRDGKGTRFVVRIPVEKQEA
jgi:signal transduction histidine kinase